MAVLLLLWSSAATAGVVTALRTWSAVEPPSAAAEEPWSYPPRIVGRVQAEVLDVDRLDGRTSLDVAFTAAGRLQHVTWVDATHLRPAPDVGSTIELAYAPQEPEVAFDLADPGLSDPYGNGYLAWDPPVPPTGTAGVLDAVRTPALLATLLTAAAAVGTVRSVAVAQRPAT